MNQVKDQLSIKFLIILFLKDMKELTPKEEDQIKNELENLFNEDIIYSTEERYEENENTINNELLKARAGENEENGIFKNKDLEPKKISKERLLLNQAIIITRNISEVDFMNSLCSVIDHKFKNHCYLKESIDSLKIEAIFTYDESEEEAKEEKEKEHFGDFKMKIELFKYKEGKYLLEFLRTAGKFPDYYQRFLEIKKLISNNFNKK